MKSAVWKSVRRNWALYFFMLPMIAYFIVFNYIPIYGVQIAFQDYKLGQSFGESQWVGFKHFLRFFNSYWFPTLMRNTISISLLQFAIGFPLPIILALMLNEVHNSRFKKMVQTFTYAPYFISTVVLCGALQLFLSPSMGIIGIGVNALRSVFGAEPINLLMEGPAFKWIYVLSGVWQGTGWSSVIYFAALSGVDIQLLDAARVDGANKLQRIRYINLPVLIPTIVIQLILFCGSILNVGFEKVYLLQNDTILSASEVISTYVYRVGMTSAEYSFASAVGLFNNLINAVLLLLVNWATRCLSGESSLF